MTQLLLPTLGLLPDYRAALERGWESSSVDGAAVARRELAWIDRDPAGFVACQDDPAALGPPVTLPDGTTMPRLPGLRRWIWDEGFCGSIGLRWQRGTAALPPHVLGHLGYAVVPWRRREGQATRALGLMLAEARRRGLPHVELTTDPDNLPSQRAILAWGGGLVERFREHAAYGGGEGLRFRIGLGPAAG